MKLTALGEAIEKEIYRRRQAKSGRSGGQATKAKYGSEYFARIARMRHRKSKLQAKRKKNAKRNNTVAVSVRFTKRPSKEVA